MDLFLPIQSVPNCPSPILWALGEDGGGGGRPFLSFPGGVGG